MKLAALKVAFVLIFCCLPIVALASGPQGVPNPQVFVLGTIHKNHIDKRWGYSFADLAQTVRQLRPDLICAELYQRDAANGMQGYYPPENAVIAQVARELGAVFFAADWRGSYTDDAHAVAAMSVEEHRAFDHAHDAVIARMPFGTAKIVEAYQAPDIQGLIKQAHDVRMTAGTEVADGFWLARNQMIVKNCMREATKRNAAKILFTFGFEHKYIIEENLRTLYGLDTQTTKIVKAADSSISALVIDAWRDDLRNLRKVATDPAAAAEVKLMIKDANRLADLEQCIEAKGKPH